MNIFLMVLLAVVVVAVIASWSKLVPIFGSMRGYFHEVGLEMNKVTWPTTQEVLDSTVLVFIVAIAMTVMIMCVDWVFAWIFGHLILNQ